MTGPTPQIVRDTDQIRRLLRGWRGNGDTIVLVPLTDAPHHGHSGLLDTARRHAKRVVVSVFDPADLTQTAEIGRDGCDLIFASGAAPESTRISTAGTGPGDQDAIDAHTTLIARVFGQVQPDLAVIGEKDWQQLVAIRQMVRDLALPVGIVSAATMREPDGLAMSSATARMSGAERALAPTLHKVLTASAELIAQGNPVDQVVAATGKFLTDSGFSSVRYIAARRAHDLAPITRFNAARPARLFAAVTLGEGELADNVPIRRATP